MHLIIAVECVRAIFFNLLCWCFACTVKFRNMSVSSFPLGWPLLSTLLIWCMFYHGHYNWSSYQMQDSCSGLFSASCRQYHNWNSTKYNHKYTGWISKQLKDIHKFQQMNANVFVICYSEAIKAMDTCINSLNKLQNKPYQTESLRLLHLETV